MPGYSDENQRELIYHWDSIFLYILYILVFKRTKSTHKEEHSVGDGVVQGVPEKRGKILEMT